MKILIADDELVSRTLLEATLRRQGHDVVAVEDGLSAIVALSAPDAPRLAILDWMMPGASGLDVCRALRKSSDAYVYVVLLTGRNTAEDMVAGLDAGADDFLTKPFNAAELRARLMAGARVLELQASLLQAQEVLRTHATLDFLTGLWNRRMMLEQLDREIKRVARENRSLTVALADIDRFKSINDTWGHAVGDDVLEACATALATSVREYDFVGRYGGEEFLILLPGCKADNALQVCRRLCEITASQPVRAGDALVPMTISIGLACTDTIGGDAAGLLRAADEALYRAKANGRNRVESARTDIETSRDAGDTPRGRDRLDGIPNPKRRAG
jgi:diguanylate cyclase (GGDEF)-like protein